MIRKICFFGIFFICLLSVKAYSKRMAPVKVKPVIYGGIRYEAPTVPMGHILAYDAATNKLLWEKKMYEVQYNPKFETDVQDIFINQLRIEKGDADMFLVATDERERSYKVDIRDPQPDFIYKEVFPQELDLPLLNEKLVIHKSLFQVYFLDGFNSEKVILHLDNAPLFSKTITSNPILGLADSIKLKKEASKINLTIILPDKRTKWTCSIDFSKGSYIGIQQDKQQILVHQSKNPFLFE